MVVSYYYVAIATSKQALDDYFLIASFLLFHQFFFSSLFASNLNKIEFVDMHFGTGPAHSTLTECDPYILDEQLSEIETCAQVSRSVFFLVSIPNMYIQIIYAQNFMQNKKFESNFVRVLFTCNMMALNLLFSIGILSIFLSSFSLLLCLPEHFLFHLGFFLY